MQRIYIIFAYFFVCANCFAQQYPFVHYTPKDGLISNQIRNIYQDSKGRLYFPSVNGLSVYDGSRFTNYTSRNGLVFDIVNCVMEMGDDSIWIITNSNKINCLVNGQIRTVNLKDTVVPIINLLVKDDKGVLYAGTDQGLYFLHKDRFIKLPFIDTKDKDVNSFIICILPAGDHLLIQRDYGTLLDQRSPLYLYNKVTKKITEEVAMIYSVNKAPDGRIWVSTEKNILSVDTTELKKGKIVLKDLAAKFVKLKNLGRHFILFDQEGNCWLGDQNHTLLKATPDGAITSFTASSGLSMFSINTVFKDREGITWIATNNGGVNKLVNSNFSFAEIPVEISPLSDISYYETGKELLLYSGMNEAAAITREYKQAYYKVKNANQVTRLIETPHGIFGIWVNNIYKMTLRGNALYPEIILNDSTDNSYSGSLVDKNGNFIVCGRYNLSAIIKGKTICRRKLNSFSDQVAMDSKGNIWIAIRSGELVMYVLHPDDPSNYLEQKRIFSKQLSGISPRSIAIDMHDNIWVGTRSHGIFVFGLQNENLTKQFHLTTGSGLSDDFITYLTSDAENNIWACSASGLDKISEKRGTPVVENITKQNNIYQTVFKVVVDKNNTAWCLVSNGLIKIASENKLPTQYSPTLFVNLVKAGKDTILEEKGNSLSYKQNNLSFYFAATSFLDEKQILYSYRLHGGSNDQWSEPSSNAMVSFIDLRPGDYTLDVKATYPAGRYPEQFIKYTFSIAPPWWQTWWFRSMAGVLLVAVFIYGFRFYYRRKLEKQMTILEKQQAVEKERARIATDMHDDLGAGLTRIKFITEGIAEKNTDPGITYDTERLKFSSNELVEKMSEIIWAMSDKNNTLEDLVFYMRSYAVEYCNENNLACEFNIPEIIPDKAVGSQMRRNVFLVLKECLHNVVKHAKATQVIVTIVLQDKLLLTVSDDGKGIGQHMNNRGNGLLNMSRRAEDMHGSLEVSNAAGTTIRLNVPV